MEWGVGSLAQQVQRLPGQGKHCYLPIEHRPVALVEGTFLSSQREWHSVTALPSCPKRDGRMVVGSFELGEGRGTSLQKTLPQQQGLPRVRAEHLWGGGSTLPSRGGI